MRQADPQNAAAGMVIGDLANLPNVPSSLALPLGKKVPKSCSKFKLRLPRGPKLVPLKAWPVLTP